MITRWTHANAGLDDLWDPMIFDMGVELSSHHKGASSRNPRSTWPMSAHSVSKPRNNTVQFAAVDDNVPNITLWSLPF